MRRAFTLIELLVICAILATMTAVGVGSIVSGRGTARVKGATRDVYAAIRHARSVALLTGQQVIVTYSEDRVDDEPVVRIEVAAAKIMSADSGGRDSIPYWVEDYKDLPRAAQPAARADGADAAAGKGEGETIEEILFSPMAPSVVTGMRIKALKGDELTQDETDVQQKSRISVFSNVDYLKGLYEETKKETKNGVAESSPASGGSDDSSSGGSDRNEPLSVVWETNGAVEPHKIWIYPDGKKPEDGLMLNVDQFGGIKVMDGDGTEED